MPIEAHKLLIIGQVQGVGFRPFIHNLATRLNLLGSVQNLSGEVEVIIQGEVNNLYAFKQQLIDQSPAIAEPKIATSETIQNHNFTQFSILKSKENLNTEIHLPVDYFICEDCKKEITDPSNFRYQYPFTNCTQCGPRYTLIEKLPYDRVNTTMASFKLCPQCEQEYSTPTNRRFHAEPIACPSCGPQLEFRSTKLSNSDDPLTQTIQHLNAGHIIAIKGIGGYHIVCDAFNTQAIERLRKNKQRPDKPLAVMFADISNNDWSHIEQQVTLNNEIKALIKSTQRPIVLCSKSSTNTLGENIAPNLNEVGVLLPYSPLHYLLLENFKRPIVCTSGNISGEPVITDNDECEHKLAHIVDGFLHHNRPIVRPADDSVYRQIGDQIRPIRLGRGTSPLELSLPFQLTKPVIATGAQMKNNIAIGEQSRVIISPHIGELTSLSSQSVFENCIKDLSHFYHIDSKTILSDAHPAYSSYQWAKKQKLTNSSITHKTILHHHAHASALVGEYMIENKQSHNNQKWLVFCWDGVGLGDEKQLWGGETFIGKPGNWKRAYSLKTFKPLGADKAARQSWRSAAATIWQLKPNYRHKQADNFAFQAWQKNINNPATSAIGRLFDAASYLAGFENDYSYEGQGPCQFEALVNTSVAEVIDLPISNDNPKEIDWTILIEKMANMDKTAEQKATIFHQSLAQLVVNICSAEAHNRSLKIGLCGGVFQNHQLVKSIQSNLKHKPFNVFIPKILPANDAAISFGQIIEDHFA